MHHNDIVEPGTVSSNDFDPPSNANYGSLRLADASAPPQEQQQQPSGVYSSTSVLRNGHVGTNYGQFE
jgi:hypothetical protein